MLIQDEPLTPETLRLKWSGSYEVLFSKRAQLTKKRKLNERQLSEESYKSLLLEHYTFLKRPVLIYDERTLLVTVTKEADAKKWLDEH